VARLKTLDSTPNKIARTLCRRETAGRPATSLATFLILSLGPTTLLTTDSTGLWQSINLPPRNMATMHLMSRQRCLCHLGPALGQRSEERQRRKMQQFDNIIIQRAVGAGSCWSVRSLRTYLGMDFSSAMG